MVYLSYNLKLLISFLIAILSYFFLIYFKPNYFQEKEKCDEGLIEVNNKCHRLFDCNDIKDIKLFSIIGQGSVKLVYLAKWKNIYLAFSKLKNTVYKHDFLENLNMLKKFASNKLITQFYGDCNQTIIFTRFYPYGSALNLPIIIKKYKMKMKINQCLKFCISYIKIIDYLHKSPFGVRVMCDSNSLEKTLSQYLVDENFNLVLNDLDAIPKMTEKGIKCGKKQIFGNFVAPEQLWPFEDQDFQDSKMPYYNEKVDIWKIPDVCDWFIKICAIKHELKYRLNQDLNTIRKKCKSLDANLRPNSSQVLVFYENVFNRYNF